MSECEIWDIQMQKMAYIMSERGINEEGTLKIADVIFKIEELGEKIQRQKRIMYLQCYGVKTGTMISENPKQQTWLHVGVISQKVFVEIQRARCISPPQTWVYDAQHLTSSSDLHFLSHLMK